MTAEQEAAAIERWHIERFMELDFDWGEIQTLLAWNTEPHDVEKLVRRGCTPELALRILQPDGDPVVIEPVVH